MRRYRISFVRLVFYGLVTLALSGKRIEHEGRDDVCVDIEAAVGNILGHGPPAARGMRPGIFIAVQPRVVAAKGGTSMLSSCCPWDTRIVSTLWCDSHDDTEPPGIRYVATTLRFTSVSTRQRRLKFPLVRE